MQRYPKGIKKDSQSYTRRIVDQRSIHLQHNIFNPDPSVVGRLAASAAASEMRAEATHAVSAVMTEATPAVAAARAQTSEAAVRAEATQAAAQAREAAMEFELRSLRTMVESLRAENNDLRDRARMIESQSPNANSNPNLNGAAIEHRTLGIENFIQRDILPRLTHLEGMFTLLRDLDHEVRENMLPRMQGFDESVQQIMDWLETSAVNAPPRANIQQEPNSQPGSPVHHAIWDESDVEDDQERNQEAGQDVEGRSLRHSPLEAPTADPRASCQLQALAKCCPNGFACLWLSTEGLLGPWLSRAFTAGGTESAELSRDSGDFLRCDRVRVIASLLCRQETLKSSFALKIQSYVERCEIAGENIRGRYILNMISTEFDTANVSTSITTSLELFQLPAPQDSVQGLKHWHDKVTYILSQFSVHQRPADEMLTQWAYNSLKRHPLLR